MTLPVPGVDPRLVGSMVLITTTFALTLVLLLIVTLLPSRRHALQILLLMIWVSALPALSPRLAPPLAYHHSFNSGDSPQGTGVTILDARGWTQHPDGLALDPGQQGTLMLRLPAPWLRTIHVQAHLYRQWGSKSADNRLELSRDGVTFELSGSQLHLVNETVSLGGLGTRPLLLRISAFNPSDAQVLVVDDLRFSSQLHPLVLGLFILLGLALTWPIAGSPLFARLLRLPSDASPLPSPPPASVPMFLLLFTYLALAFVVVLNHEMWRDELQTWLTVRASHSLPELFHNKRYDGFPLLWYLSLYPLSRLTDNPLAMQLFHLGVATTVVYLVLRFAPLTTMQKSLFIVGYFPLFEYGVISRPYALGALLLFAFVALWVARPTAYVPAALLLFLLAQTTAYGLILAGALALARTFEAVLGIRRGPGPGPAPRRLLLAVSIVLAGAVLSVATGYPARGHDLVTGWVTRLDYDLFTRTLATVWKAYVPLPRFQEHFWNTNVLDPSPEWQLYLSLVALMLSIGLCAARPAAVILLLAGATGVLTFVYTKYFGYLRHHGHLFLLLLAAVWLARSSPGGRTLPEAGRGLPGLCRRYHGLLVTGLLAAHALAGLFAAGADLLLPFSASRDVARFIRGRWPDGVVIVGHTDVAASSVTGYLGRPLYYPAMRAFGTFVVYAPRESVSSADLLREATRLSAERRQDVVLVLDFELPQPTPVQLIRVFPDSIVGDERYWVYLARYAPG